MCYVYQGFVTMTHIIKCIATLLLTSVAQLGVICTTNGGMVFFISPLSAWHRTKRSTERGEVSTGGYQTSLGNRNTKGLGGLMVDPLGGIPGLGMDMDFDSDMGDQDPTAAITDADIQEITKLIRDVKQGKMGPVWKREMLAAEELCKRRDAAIRKMPGGSDDEPKPDVKELLNEKNDALDSKLSEIFDLSNLQHPSDEDIIKSLNQKREDDKGLLENAAVPSESDENDEQYFRDASEGKLGTKELKNLVHNLYRQKGLLNEPVVKTMVGRFDIHWKQNNKTFDIWFPCVSPDDKEDDYAISFLPQRLTITYKGASVSGELRGKVNVDGCFWSMQNNPEKGKVVGIVLLKRAPKFMNTWDHLFRGTSPEQPQS